MSRITQAFVGGKAFMPFITGGDPDIETTEQLLYALVEAGADLIKIGVPFSDPVAEGPAIEAANERALAKGCTVDDLFKLVARVRRGINIPLLFRSYYNPIFAYGVEKFTANCAACGVDGLIVPDLPFEERDELLGPCRAQGLALISLLAPTGEERAVRIAQNAKGFLYCVSPCGAVAERTLGLVRRVSEIPCAMDVEQAQGSACDGVIVGSAIVGLVGEHGRACVEPVAAFARGVKQSINSN